MINREADHQHFGEMSRLCINLFQLGISIEPQAQLDVALSGGEVL